MQRTLYSGHLSVADTILMSRLTFPPRSDLLIAETSKNESQKNSYKKLLYILYQTVFHIFFKFLFYFVYFIIDPVYGLFRAMKIRIDWNFQSVYTSIINALSSYKDVQNTMGQGLEHKYNLGIATSHISLLISNSMFER